MGGKDKHRHDCDHEHHHKHGCHEHEHGHEHHHEHECRHEDKHEHGCRHEGGCREDREEWRHEREERRKRWARNMMATMILSGSKIDLASIDTTDAGFEKLKTQARNAYRIADAMLAVQHEK